MCWKPAAGLHGREDAALPPCRDAASLCSLCCMLLTAQVPHVCTLRLIPKTWAVSHAWPHCSLSQGHLQMHQAGEYWCTASARLLTCALQQDLLRRAAQRICHRLGGRQAVLVPLVARCCVGLPRIDQHLHFATGDGETASVASTMDWCSDQHLQQGKVRGDRAMGKTPAAIHTCNRARRARVGRQGNGPDWLIGCHLQQVWTVIKNWQAAPLPRLID